MLQKTGKVSSFKLTNKKTTKLAKRGQLDHQKKRRKDALKAKHQSQKVKGVCAYLFYLTV